MKDAKQDEVRPISGAMLDEMRSEFVRVSDARDLDKACKCPKEVLLCNICENLFKLPAAVCDYDASAKTTPLKNIDFQEVDIERSDVARCVLQKSRATTSQLLILKESMRMEQSFLIRQKVIFLYTSASMVMLCMSFMQAFIQMGS